MRAFRLAVQKTVLSLLFLLRFFVTASPLLAAERIHQFSSDIVVQPDGSIQITETIQYETDQQKHGIYRYVPTEYVRSGWSQTAHVRVESITDELGTPIPYEQSWDSGNITWKIGDPDTTFTGRKTYVIQYEIDDALQNISVDENSPARPELYWDITGEGWQVDIASVAATIQSPSATITDVACYSGKFGSDDGLCSIDRREAHAVTLTYPDTISYGDNMTVAVAFDPAGAWVLPSWWERLWQWLQDNLLLIPVVLPGLALAGAWWYRGRDREFTSWNVFAGDDGEDKPQRWAPLISFRRPPFVYEPHTDLTPGQAGALLDERVDNQDVIAEIIDLARRKYLRIEQTEKKQLLGKKREYTLVRLKSFAAAKKLPEHQEYLFTHLFDKEVESVKLEDLKGSFYTHFEKVRSKIFTSLATENYFRGNPQQVRGLAFGAAAVLSFLSILASIFLFQKGIILGLPIMAGSVAASFLFASVMSAKTARGRNAMWRAKGLQRMIQAGAWRQEIQEKHLFIEEVFPFAVAFGVVKKLSKDMEALQVTAPEYLPVASAYAFSSSDFVDSFSQTATQSLSYNPSSGSYSSGSGFSGGFSGGGGGGGGGGSW
ncbi:DUF2207 domain-containing protein [Candidatus Woesebacteria bacterium]|nr:DUF2207 domain-containing protein [Candidatus Woesebacteria bacterium]